MPDQSPLRKVQFHGKWRISLILPKSQGKSEVINASINSTLGRTIITSFITFMVMTIMFVFGGSSIKGFTFGIMIGIAIGTYSSVFIAGAVVHDMVSDIRPKTVIGQAKPKTV